MRSKNCKRAEVDGLFVLNPGFLPAAGNPTPACDPVQGQITAQCRTVKNWKIREKLYRLPYKRLIILHMCCPPETSSGPEQRGGGGLGTDRRQRGEGLTALIAMQERIRNEKHTDGMNVVYSSIKHFN